MILMHMIKICADGIVFSIMRIYYYNLAQFFQSKKHSETTVILKSQCFWCY